MAKSVSFSPAQGTALIRGATILFEPSNFDENNNPRKNIVLAVDEETIETVRAWEEQIDSDKLSSNISKYSLRAQICMDTVRARDGKNLTELPETMKGKTANVMVSLSGIWASKKQAGLSLTVTDLEFCECIVESPFVETQN